MQLETAEWETHLSYRNLSQRDKRPQGDSGAGNSHDTDSVEIKKEEMGPIPILFHAKPKVQIPIWLGLDHSNLNFKAQREAEEAREFLWAVKWKRSCSIIAI